MPYVVSSILYLQDQGKCTMGRWCSTFCDVPSLLSVASLHNITDPTSLSVNELSHINDMRGFTCFNTGQVFGFVNKYKSYSIVVV